MKSVLISIRPKWCELIANGKKTIELRKSRPKLETPFKCYIYKTMTGYVSRSKENDILIPVTYGKVIGEFVCDDIDEVSVYYDTLYCMNNTQPKKFTQMRLTLDEVIEYLGEKNHGYTWHISDLKIYDTPKELKEFKAPCTQKCNYLESCGGTNAEECLFGISRPPQSWCYVEDLE